MRTEYVTRTRIAVDGRGDAEARLDFPRASGKGKARARAVRRLAVIYKIDARHPWRTMHYNPASPDAPAPTPDELTLELSGTPERVARYLSAVPRYLAAVEALATRAVRVYGQWARSVAAEEALEYVDAGGRRAYAAQFRAAAFTAGADYLGIASLPPRDLDPSRPMWDQAARIVWDLVKVGTPVNLYAMHDEAEAEELLASADRAPAPTPADVAFERELAELRTAQARRSVALFAALDGEELPSVADLPAVEEAPAEDVVEGQEDEELPAVPLTRVQRRWLHTAAAHPEGHLPEEVNLRTVRALGLAGYAEWSSSRPYAGRLSEAVWKPRGGEVRITAAGRQRAEREERELVVVVACGGRKAVYSDGLRKGEPVIGARAGELYVGSYHRAARRAADVLTRDGRAGRVVILSARYGLVELDEHLLNYNLRAGDPGTVDGETLRRQAHALGISGAAVTVLGGRAYTKLAREVWEDVVEPLAGTRGIGEQLGRLADIYAPDRHRVAVEAELVEDQAEELGLAEEPLARPAAGRAAEVRVETAPAALVRVRHPRALSGYLSRRLSRGALSRPVSCADSPFPPSVVRTRQRGGQGDALPTCHPYRWTAARPEDRLSVMRDGERMRPMIAAASVALVLLSTGCVSVAPQGPTPRLSPAAAPRPAPSSESVTQAPAREELVRVGSAPSSPPARPKRTAATPPEESAAAPHSPGRPAVAPVVPRRAYRPEPPRRVRPAAPPRREVRPPVRRPAPVRRPSTGGYGMADVCRSAQGVADPSLVALCGSAYGGK
ncbi:DUF6884 domain-containing protein [Streptomyces sp. NBC_00078]|uniref:DUF6884 domain-containing protein n=1 Tax=Streptomyces sp. NBC_00078 TaxID=2975643 RepID=UPI0022542679|nr:DUF6884 domain-containing protein [Streptomyces sp. NBC_00078]MCX5426125.1 hypothetical protein [Streptomyces sp. NBC_00078]